MAINFSTLSLCDVGINANFSLMKNNKKYVKRYRHATQEGGRREEVGNGFCAIDVEGRSEEGRRLDLARLMCVLEVGGGGAVVEERRKRKTFSLFEPAPRVQCRSGSRAGRTARAFLPQEAHKI